MTRGGIATGVDHEARTFDRSTMETDFVRRWNQFNPEPPTPERIARYCDQYERVLRREGYAAATEDASCG